MDVLPFKSELHAQIIDTWLVAHGKSKLSDGLPSIGFIAFLESEPVAASFLRYVEGGYCLFDGLVSNPSLPPFKRHLAIDAVVTALIKKAKDLNLTKILAYSLDEGTLKRSFGHGFKLLPHRLIVLDLAEKELI